MIRKLIRKVPWLHRSAVKVKQAIAPKKPDSSWTSAPILQEYVTTFPSPQNAVDIFKGEWWSVLPDERGKLLSENTYLFEDDQVLPEGLKATAVG